MKIKPETLTKKPLTVFYREILDAIAQLTEEPDFVERGKREIYIYREMRLIRKISGRCRVDLYHGNSTIPLTNKFLLQLILNDLNDEISECLSKPE